MHRIYIHPSWISNITTDYPFATGRLMEHLLDYKDSKIGCEFVTVEEEFRGRMAPDAPFVRIGGNSHSHPKKWFCYVQFDNADDAVMFKLTWNEKS